LRTRYERYLNFVLDRRWPVILGYFAVTTIILVIVAPHIGSEIFPDPNGPVLRMRLKAPVGTRIEATEPMVIQALDLIRRTVGKDNVEITSDYVGVQPSSYPVNLIHLFTSGPEEALVQVQLRPGHPDDERLREDLRAAFRKEMPKLTMAFEAGDIISQVMSFGSPTPIQIDVQGVDIDQDYAYLAKVETELNKLDFLRDISIVQTHLYPTVEVTINRNYAGQFGLTIADVTNSLTPATGSSRFTAPNYWRDPRTGNAFQIQVQLPSNTFRVSGRSRPCRSCAMDKLSRYSNKLPNLSTEPNLKTLFSGLDCGLSVSTNACDASRCFSACSSSLPATAPGVLAASWSYRPVRKSGNAHRWRSQTYAQTPASRPSAVDCARPGNLYRICREGSVSGVPCSGASWKSLYS
jgi:hypothetical protein